jgi:hypothetical protein
MAPDSVLRGELPRGLSRSRACFPSARSLLLRLFDSALQMRRPAKLTRRDAVAEPLVVELLLCPVALGNKGLFGRLEAFFAKAGRNLRSGWKCLLKYCLVLLSLPDHCIFCWNAAVEFYDERFCSSTKIFLKLRLQNEAKFP